MFSCSEMRGKSKKHKRTIEISRKPCHHNYGRFPFVVRPDRAQIHGWGAAGSKPVLLLSSKVIDDRTIPKKKTKVGPFSKRAAVRPLGAYLTLSFRKKCSGTPPEGVTQLHFSLTWGLTDRQVSLPPFRALLRSGGPEPSKNLDSSGLSGAGFRQLLLSWGAGFRQLLLSWVAGFRQLLFSFFSWGAGFRQLLFRFFRGGAGFRQLPPRRFRVRGPRYPLG